MEFTPQNQLEEALFAAFNNKDSIELYWTFISIFLISDFFSPATSSYTGPKEVSVVLEADITANFGTYDNNGELLVPIFSSYDRMIYAYDTKNREYNYLKLKGRVILENFAKKGTLGLVVNPVTMGFILRINDLKNILNKFPVENN